MLCPGSVHIYVCLYDSHKSYSMSVFQNIKTEEGPHNNGWLAKDKMRNIHSGEESGENASFLYL